MTKEERQHAWFVLNKQYHKLRTNLEQVERRGMGNELALKTMRQEVAKAKKASDNANEGWT